MRSSQPVTRVVGADIVRGRSCLVAQRRPDCPSGPLEWEFPGGKIEPGEAPRAALEREIREELGLEIEIGPWLGCGESPVGDRIIRLDVYTARILAGAIRLEAHCRYGWFRAEEIDSLGWAAADRPVLPALRALLAARSPAG